MKHQAHFAILALISISASCNYTDGPCWPVGQDGNGGPSGGVVGNPGAGSPGDGTQTAQQPLTSDPCNASAPAPAKGGGSGSGTTEGTPPQGSDTGTGGAEPQGGSACQNKCYSDYDVALNACVKFGSDTADRKACHDAAHAAMVHCMGACVSTDCLEACKQGCDGDWEKCRDHCPRGDKNCLSECTNTLSRCYKDCDRRCK